MSENHEILPTSGKWAKIMRFCQLPKNGQKSRDQKMRFCQLPKKYAKIISFCELRKNERKSLDFANFAKMSENH